ncbi:lipase [Desulfocucumis palustris]|uniref:Lipase n=2 Tax=Desulfocucumis palustris TaxID=1898651 RepID=A0A2L2XAX5_9FIRM|nr:lipase [Desulfocucumis palustris]
MLPLGEYLAGRGFTVSGARLPGHGTSPSHLRGITYRHWIDSARSALLDLQKNCARVYVAGFSMGGTIALHLAANHDFMGLIVICAPVKIYINFYLMRLLNLLRNFKQEVQQNIKDPAARKNHIAYDSAPPSAGLQLYRLLRAVGPEIPGISMPVLIFQSTGDGIVAPENANFLYNRLAKAAARDLVWLKNSGHMATLDYDREMLFDLINQFVSRDNNHIFKK